MHKLLFFAGMFFTLSLSAQTEAVEATLMGTWDDPSLVGSSAYNNTYNDVWGLALDGREYAVIGSTAGTHFLDVTNPENIRQVDFVAGASAGPHIIHRDFHHYGCYIYSVADEGQSSTLQIIDISMLPDSVSVVYDSNESLVQAHNIFIDSLQAKLYCLSAFGGEAGGSAMRIYDISDPVNPEYLAEYNNFGGLQTSSVHDAYIHDGLAYLNCGYSGFAMVDFTDPMNPQTLGTMTDYAFAGYNHSGWPSNDGNYYYLSDENHGYPIKVLDVSDPTDISDIGVLDAPGDDLSQTIPHNQIVACDYLYVSYYYDGLMVYDVSDPANPTPAYYYDTSDWPFDNNYRGAWGVYPFLPSGNILVSDMQRGLFVLHGPDTPCVEQSASTLSCNEVINSTAEPEWGDELSVFPQPAGTDLNLRFPAATEGTVAELSLLDLHGRTVHVFGRTALAAGTTSLALPELPTGMYLLKVQAEEWGLTRKVLVQQ
jgi:choice-of-anchor B domain-containing protein